MGGGVWGSVGGYQGHYLAGEAFHSFLLFGGGAGGEAEDEVLYAQWQAVLCRPGR